MVRCVLPDSQQRAESTHSGTLTKPPGPGSFCALLRSKMCLSPFLQAVLLEFLNSVTKEQKTPDGASRPMTNTSRNDDRRIGTIDATGTLEIMLPNPPAVATRSWRTKMSGRRGVPGAESATPQIERQGANSVVHPAWKRVTQRALPAQPAGFDWLMLLLQPPRRPLSTLGKV